MSNQNKDLQVNLSLSNILIAILNQIKEIEIPAEQLFATSEVEQGLELSYDDEKNVYLIKLGEKNGSGNSND